MPQSGTCGNCGGRQKKRDQPLHGMRMQVRAIVGIGRGGSNGEQGDETGHGLFLILWDDAR